MSPRPIRNEVLQIIRQMKVNHFLLLVQVFSVQVDLQQEWRDSHLNQSYENGTLKLEGSTITEKLWTPRTHVTNARAQSSEERMSYALIGYNGTVQFGQV